MDLIPIERVTFADFVADPKKYEEEMNYYWNSRGKWVDAQMEERGFMWIAICGGEVVDGSPDTFDFPNDEEFKELGRKYDKIPFVYSRPMLPE